MTSHPAAPNEVPRVAVVIPNYNGIRHLGKCIQSLHECDYPAGRLRILVVDNGSVDGSVPWLRAKQPEVQVQENGENLGFAAACNLGAKLAARADVVVFLNNDMRVDRSFLLEITKPIASGMAECVGAKILSWDGKTVDYAGGGMSFHGIAFQVGYGENATPAALDEPAETLFACGGAMAVSRCVFEAAGGFDEDFFAYYEDADLGWRLWILGHRVLYHPRAFCYHHHSATARTFPQERIRLLQVRNPLLTILKNYGDGNVERTLCAAILLAARRGLEVGGIDMDAFRIEKTRSRRTGGVREVLARAHRRLDRKLRISKTAVADFMAIADLGEMLPGALAKRRAIQARRRREDAEIVNLFKNPFWCVEPREPYRILQRTLEEFLHLRGIFE